MAEKSFYAELHVNDDKVLKLKLRVRDIVALERKIGESPLNLLMNMNEGTIPKLDDMVLILQASLQKYEHGYDIDKTYDLLDEYFENGNTIIDLVPVIIKIFEVSGFINIDEDEKIDVDENLK